MSTLVSTAFILFGTVIGWLVVYFVRKYKEYNPKVLRNTSFMFLGGVCIEFPLALLDGNLCIIAILAYIIGVSIGFFIHWIYQWLVVKFTAPRFMDPISRYELFSGCNIQEESKKELSKTAYQLERISKGFEQLRKGLITESEFKKLIADAGLTYDMIDELTDSIWGKFYFSPDIAAYIKAKGLLDEQ